MKTPGCIAKKATDRSDVGKIFDIQKFSVNDGPGIRTLVFFKGCPLKCQWCSNPESQRRRVELMHFQDLCQLCEMCSKDCETDCIQIRDGKWGYNEEKCISCQSCAEACPSRAIRFAGKDITVEEVVSVADQDYLFYLNSGGGVTIGGGEPTMQPAFLCKLLQRLKELGIHTAIETCGHTDWQVFEELLPNLDLLLFDIKHIDPEVHRTFTGKSNQLILENFSKLLSNEVPMIVRIPLIPNFNDSKQCMADICSFVSAS